MRGLSVMLSPYSDRGEKIGARVSVYEEIYIYNRIYMCYK
jgi:hypothetical protein